MYNQTSNFLLVRSRTTLTTDDLQPFKYKIFIKVFHCIVKSLETFLFEAFSKVMPKNRYKSDVMNFEVNLIFLIKPFFLDSLIENPYFSTYCQNFTQTTLKPNQTLFGRTYQIFQSNITFLSNKTKHFNDFQNRNFSVL